MKFLIEATAIKFLAVGFANTAFGLAVIYGCKWLLGLGDVVSNATGYGVGILLSFVLNKRWTFQYRRDMLPAFGRFLVVLGVAYLLNLATVLAALQMGVNGYLAQTLGVIPYTLFSYVGSKLYVFPADARPAGDLSGKDRVRTRS